MSKLACLLSAFLISIGIGVPAAWSQGFVKDVPTRPGVIERVKIVKPPRATAIVVLLPGGGGILAMSPDGTPQEKNNSFTTKAAPLFAKRGFIVALVDAPSDHLHEGARGIESFRGTAEHAQDLGAVIREMRQLAPLPVWVVGTSQSSTSAANVAARLGRDGPDGIVLTSTGAVIQKLSVDIGSISVPTLIVRNDKDVCPRSTASVSLWVYNTLHAKGVKSEYLTVSGGGPVQGDPCGGHYYHGYFGIEDQTVDLIANWIRQASPSAPTSQPGASGPVGGMSPGGPGRGSAGAAEGLFQRYDSNGDGVVTLDEFMAERRHSLLGMDKNGDGFVSQDEYIAGAPDAMPMPRRTAMFAALDKNGDGKLSPDEIDAASRAIFHILDQRGDGRLTAQDFAAFRGPPVVIMIGVPTGGPTGGGPMGGGQMGGANEGGGQPGANTNNGGARRGGGRQQP